jgi:hypothetical protein
MSINNISPRIWGPHGWKFLHYVTFSYPENPTNEDKENYKFFFNSVGSILPCFTCRENYKNHLKKFPLDDNTLKTQFNLVSWLINIHNEVNKIHGEKILSYNEVLNIYFPKKVDYSRYYPLILFVIIVLIWIIYKKSTKSDYDIFVSKINLI